MKAPVPLPIILCLFFGGGPGTLVAADMPVVKVDKASVLAEHRGAREWLVLDSQVSSDVPVALDTLLGVIQDYPAYPKMFSRIREVRFEFVPGATLLTEKVVVSALGIQNVNWFTLRLVRTDLDKPRRAVRVDWTQDWTDGTIDSLEGHWLLEERGTAQAPLTRVVYRTKSAVPVVAFGQETLLKMFQGSETKVVVEVVAKRALIR